MTLHLPIGPVKSCFGLELRERGRGGRRERGMEGEMKGGEGDKGG